ASAPSRTTWTWLARWCALKACSANFTSLGLSSTSRISTGESGMKRFTREKRIGVLNDGKAEGVGSLFRNLIFHDRSTCYEKDSRPPFLHDEEDFDRGVSHETIRRKRE